MIRIGIVTCIVFTLEVLLFRTLRHLFSNQTHFALVCGAVIHFLLLVFVLISQHVLIAKCFFIVLDQACLRRSLEAVD